MRSPRSVSSRHPTGASSGFVIPSDAPSRFRDAPLVRRRLAVDELRRSLEPAGHVRRRGSGARPARYWPRTRVDQRLAGGGDGRQQRRGTGGIRRRDPTQPRAGPRVTDPAHVRRRRHFEERRQVEQRVAETAVAPIEQRQRGAIAADVARMEVAVDERGRNAAGVDCGHPRRECLDEAVERRPDRFGEALALSRDQVRDRARQRRASASRASRSRAAPPRGRPRPPGGGQARTPSGAARLAVRRSGPYPGCRRGAVVGRRRRGAAGRARPCPGGGGASRPRARRTVAPP